LFKAAVVKPDKQIANVIERLFMSGNSVMLRQLVLDSITSVERDVFRGNPTEETSRMRGNAETAAHGVLLVIFMLLLNVDHELKSTVMAYEVAENKPKLVRFMLDLRQTLVIDFFTDELIDVPQFVQQCENCYILS
tara:strand:+ start:769 stop:1176 length:408 start_codon:yes stop_codon:yes gene_type:complete